MDGFVQVVASRLPLAELVLRLFDFVCRDDFLSDVFRRHRGRSYEGVLSFPTQALATQLKITLLFLPSYSPNLNLIERPWKFIKRRAVYGRYHPGFQAFQTAIQATIAELTTRYAEPLKSLMTLNFQRFEDVSLLAA